MYKSKKSILKMKTLNNIRRTASVVLAACVVSLAVAGCEKEKSSQRGIRIVAEKHHNNTKTTVDGASVYWVEGDKVNINGTDYELNNTTSSEARVEVTGYANAVVSAAYPAEDVVSISETTLELNLPSVYTYSVVGGRQEVAFPMAARGLMEEDGELKFKHLCAAALVTVANTSGYPMVMNSITVSSDASQLCGLASIDISGADAAGFSVPATATGDAALRKVMLTFGEETVIIDNGATASFQIPILPIAGNDKLHFVINAGEKKIPGVSVTGVYKYSSPDITVNQDIQRSQVIATPDIAIGAGESNVSYTSSKVTVNASGKQVYFSQGDLEYNTNSGTWQFGEESDAYTSFDKAPVYDIFRFGNCTGNPSSPAATTDLVGSAEWGNLPITNGGNTANSGWRTPSMSEFAYMLRYRTTDVTINGISNCHFLQCKVNGQKGLMIFPDNFADNMPADIDYSGWNANNLDTRREQPSAGVPAPSFAVEYVNISLDDWAKLCRVGCNFMVEDGWYKDEGEGKEHSLQEDGGAYWTSTVVPNSKDNAYILYFNNEGVTLYDWRKYSGPYSKKRINGMTVRLVRDVEL